MTNKEALDNIKYYQYTDHGVSQDAYRIAIKCIEKSIPAKPIKVRGFPSNRCPICECHVETDEVQLGYCDNCGQAIDWN